MQRGAIATRLLDSGASISLWNVDAAEKLKPLGNIHTAVVDVTRADSAETAAAATAQALGKLDILVNKAGIARSNAKVWETDPAEWHRVLDINLNGLIHGCRAVVPHLLHNGYGRIVNIGSIANLLASALRRSIRTKPKLSSMSA